LSFALLFLAYEVLTEVLYIEDLAFLMLFISGTAFILGLSGILGFSH